MSKTGSDGAAATEVERTVVATDPDREIDPELIGRLLEQAGDDRELLGEGGLLQQLTKQVLETALDTELTAHLGYERGDAEGRGSGNSRNGTSPKKVHTGIGAVDLDVPRDRNATFDPQIVPKGTRRLQGFNDRIVALYARGMTVRDIQAHLAELYDVDISPDLISKVTSAVLDEARAWQNRPLERVYAAIYLDAITCKVRTDGVVARKILENLAELRWSLFDHSRRVLPGGLFEAIRPQMSPFQGESGVEVGDGRRMAAESLTCVVEPVSPGAVMQDSLHLRLCSTPAGRDSAVPPARRHGTCDEGRARSRIVAAHT